MIGQKNIVKNVAKDGLILGILWLLSALSDRLWIKFDRSVPAWDQSEYLTAALDYWHSLQQWQLLSGEWWANFWALSSKVPPLTFILTAPWLNLFGTGAKQSLLVHLFFSGILLISVYGLGAILFHRKIGLWAAGMTLLLPGFYLFRLQYLLDYPLTASVAFSFFCLTVLQFTSKPKKLIPHLGNLSTLARLDALLRLSLWQIFGSIIFGLSFGLALLIKQTALFFLLTPIAWLFITNICQKKWSKLWQLIGSFLVTFLTVFPWFQVNWLFAISGGKRATIDSAIAEGDPGLLNIAAWTYYWQKLPQHISWPLLLIPLTGLLFYFVNQLTGLKKLEIVSLKPDRPALKWLGIFWLGAYFLCSININKDFRYSLPLLPVTTIFLAYCLMLYPRRWATQIRWGTIAIATLLMLINLWPTYNIAIDRIADIVTPSGRRHAFLGNEWPHPQVIEEIIKSEPYVRTTLGVLPSTSTVNQHNLNYYGALRNFQVYGRQVGTSLENVRLDVRSLSWFVTKTGEQGVLRKKRRQSQAAMIKAIETSPKFKLHKTWLLPDNTNLNLYHRQALPIQVYPLDKPLTLPLNEAGKVKLEKVEFPTKKFPPGKPLPVSYTWSGDGEALRKGIVLLTFSKEGKNETISNQITYFTHDQGLAMGNLQPNAVPGNFLLVEWMSMLPPANLAPGKYQVSAVYLNRETGESYPVNVPTIDLEIDNQAPVVGGPELDLVTQLRLMSADLPKGITGLVPIFDQIGRINQYDPTQDYVKQAELALKYRFKETPTNLEYAYGWALAEVLQRNTKGAIEALTKVTELDRNNPYAYAYLSFVNLYNWDGKSAEKALQPALILQPDQPEIKALNGVAVLLQGNVVKAWQELSYWLNHRL